MMAFKRLSLWVKLVGSFALLSGLASLIVYGGMRIAFNRITNNVVPALFLTTEISETSYVIYQDAFLYVMNPQPQTGAQFEATDLRLKQLLQQIDHLPSSQATTVFETLLPISEKIEAQSQAVISSHDQTLIYLANFRHIHSQIDELLMQMDPTVYTPWNVLTNLPSDVLAKQSVPLQMALRELAFTNNNLDHTINAFIATGDAQAMLQFNEVLSQTVALAQLTAVTQTSVSASELQNLQSGLDTAGRQIISSHQNTITLLNNLDLSKQELAIITKQAKTDAQNRLQDSLQLATGIVVGLLLVSGSAMLIVGFVITHRTLAPIGKLLEASRNISQGNFSARVAPTSDDEIGKLGYSFNQMAEQLQRTLKDLAQHIQQLEEAQATLTKTYEQLESRTTELSAVKSELELFAFASSHDLRSPLRGIASLTEWIEEDIGSVLTPETAQYFHLLRQRVFRMESLIDGIMQYTNTPHAEQTLEKVDVSQILNKIVNLMEHPPAFQIVVHPNMPTITTERVKLEQVLGHLINNAIKFHTRVNGHVEIDCHEFPNAYEFVVQDDGPGIAPEYHDKVFVLFQRLHTRDKIEGSGVGLALVKKIVENQGGQISLESAEGQGALFRFTWPKS